MTHARRGRDLKVRSLRFNLATVELISAPPVQAQATSAAHIHPAAAIERERPPRHRHRIISDDNLLHRFRSRLRDVPHQMHYGIFTPPQQTTDVNGGATGWSETRSINQVERISHWFDLSLL